MHLFCLFSLPLFLFSVCFQLKTENTAFCVCSWSFPDLLGTRSPPAPGGCSLHLGTCCQSAPQQNAASIHALPACSSSRLAETSIFASPSESSSTPVEINSPALPATAFFTMAAFCTDDAPPPYFSHRLDTTSLAACIVSLSSRRQLRCSPSFCFYWDGCSLSCTSRHFLI